MRPGDEKKESPQDWFDRQRTERNHAQKIRLWGVFWAARCKARFVDRVGFARLTFASAAREYRRAQRDLELARLRLEEARKYVQSVKVERDLRAFVDSLEDGIDKTALVGLPPEPDRLFTPELIKKGKE